jgi:exodeoxyribonuclease-3
MLATLQALGLHDTFRHLQPDLTERYSWFDYRSKGFVDNRGLRIDVIMASTGLLPLCTESEIDYELRGIEKPSDHAPIFASFAC